MVTKPLSGKAVTINKWLNEKPAAHLQLAFLFSTIYQSAAYIIFVNLYGMKSDLI